MSKYKKTQDELAYRYVNLPVESVPFIEHAGLVQHGQYRHDVFAPQSHHIEQRISQAREHCQQHGARFTVLREQIFRLILQSQRPLGAYDLIEQLQALPPTNQSPRKHVAPPTVYRSLTFLLEHGLIHQLSSLNAYIPCCHPRGKHRAAFLICTQCQRVQECSVLPLQDMMGFAQTQMGFLVTSSVIELQGQCRSCASLHS